MGSLYEELKSYSRTDFYPFHMPGHKRRLGSFSDPFSFDITEIEGFDNLHHAQGILKEAEERAARFFGAEETHFLVNGSTAGILSAIGACAPTGKLLLARNSHKAAFHAVSLNRLEAVYVAPRPWRETACPEAGQRRMYRACPLPVELNDREEATCPETETDHMLCPEAKGREEARSLPAELNGRVRAADVRMLLERNPDARAVYLTSPTYDGVVSEIREIAEAAHARGLPLIVDEAHGAHFGMHPIFPQSALRYGADIVIQSLHKTLPSLTQTALLHVNGSYADRARLRRLLGVYQSSSPSYVLMASIDQCVCLLWEKGRELFDEFAGELTAFHSEARTLKNIRILETDDPSKILINAPGLTGLELERILRERYHLQMEMAAGSYALALTSVGDRPEGFARLLAALRELDPQCPPEAVRERRGCWRTGEEDVGSQERDRRGAGGTEGSSEETDETGAGRNALPEACCTIFEAENRATRRVRLEDCAGCVSGEYLYLYPPGVPLVVPGERIGEALLENILEYRRNGYSLQGLEDDSIETIRVVRM